jgi:hypothetical protein
MTFYLQRFQGLRPTPKEKAADRSAAFEEDFCRN